MEDLLVDQEQWIAMDSGTKPTAISQEDWDKLERRVRSTIRLCLSMLLNVFGEDSAINLWAKLGSLYQSKSLVNKLFLQKKLFHLRMEENDNVAKHLNVYNTLVSQITSVGIKMAEEDKCITLLCSLSDSWHNLIVAIGSASQPTLKFDEIMSSLLKEEIRKKNMDSHIMDALFVRGHPQERYKNKGFGGGV